MNGFFEGPTDAHNFANALHAATEESADAVELLQVPARNLDDDIVQTGLETSTGNLRHTVLDLVQWNSET